jgi:hypothetical protein
MTFAFDLISDLHVETWDSFNWTGQPTSPYCVVAGDVSRDHVQVAQTLEHLNEFGDYVHDYTPRPNITPRMIPHTTAMV